MQMKRAIIKKKKKVTNKLILLEMPIESEEINVYVLLCHQSSRHTFAWRARNIRQLFQS